MNVENQFIRWIYSWKEFSFITIKLNITTLTITYRYMPYFIKQKKSLFSNKRL